MEVLAGTRPAPQRAKPGRARLQGRWRRFNGHELVADVLAGVKLRDGIKVTDDDHDDEMTDEWVAA